MLRLTLLLCFGMFAALMIAGEDRGQLRPGLAEAAARKADQAANPVVAADPAPSEPLTVVTAAPVTPKPVAAAAAASPKPYVEPTRELVTEVQEPVFSLASAGTETEPGAATAAAETQPAPEVADGNTGTIWYVVAESVNVRAEPSTDAAVLGKLGSGEATLLVQSVDDDWARIVIQGDGVEGFVAKRYLSPVAP